MGVRGIVIRGALGAVVALASVAGPAHAALQDFTFLGCLGVASGCAPAAGVASGPQAPDVASTADGGDVYAVFPGVPAVQHFRRAADGSLTPGGCFKHAAAEGPCTPASGSLSTVGSIAVPPDGEHVYVAQGEPATIHVFDRDPATGALTELAGQAYTAPPELPDLVDLEAPTNGVLVAGSGTAEAIVLLQRSAGTGQINMAAPSACMSDLDLGPALACAPTFTLAGLRDVAAGVDGFGDVWVYAASSALLGSVTRARAVGATTLDNVSCIDWGGDCGAGFADSLEGVTAVEVLPGVPHQVVAVSPGADALTQITNSGGLVLGPCIEAPPIDRGCAAADAKLTDVDSVAAAPDGEVAYAGSSSRAAAVEVQPSRGPQQIAAGTCFASDCGTTAAGLTDLAALVTGGSSVYGAARAGAVSVFRRGAASPPPGPPIVPEAPPPPLPRCTGAGVTLQAGRATAVPLACVHADLREIVAAPAHAVLDPIDQAAGTVTITPDASYRGLDALVFRGLRGAAGSEATISIRVTGPRLPSVTRVSRVGVPTRVRARKGRRGRLTVRWRQGSAADVLLTFHRIDSRGRSEQQVPAVLLDNGQRGSNRATVVLPRTIVDGRYRVQLRAVDEDGREGKPARSAIFRVTGTGRGETGARR